MDESSKEQQIAASLKLFVVLSRATRAINDRIAAEIRSYGLNPTEFAVLELLYHKGSQPVQVIGKKVLIASSSITYVVDKLEKKGLLQRVHSLDDRRVSLISLTDSGTQLMARIFPGHAQAIHSILNGVNHEEKQYLIQLLKQIGINAQKKQDPLVRQSIID